MGNSQPPSQSLPTLPSFSPSWLSGIHFGQLPVPSCSSSSSGGNSVMDTSLIKSIYLSMDSCCPTGGQFEQPKCGYKNTPGKLNQALAKILFKSTQR